MIPVINIVLTAIWLNCFAAMDMGIAKTLFPDKNNENAIVNTVSKKDVYNALEGNSVDQIDNVLLALDNGAPSLPVNAYKGALYMKKASLLNALNQKLNTFNQGKDLLEAEINKQNSNAELRFLRLIIQENAPAFLKYNNDIQTDKKVIMLNYKTLDEELKNIINNYANTSKVLTPSDLY